MIGEIIKGPMKGMKVKLIKNNGISIIAQVLNNYLSWKSGEEIEVSKSIIKWEK